MKISAAEAINHHLFLEMKFIIPIPPWRAPEYQLCPHSQ